MYELTYSELLVKQQHKLAELQMKAEAKCRKLNDNNYFESKTFVTNGGSFGFGKSTSKFGSPDKSSSIYSSSRKDSKNPRKRKTDHSTSPKKRVPIPTSQDLKPPCKILHSPTQRVRELEKMVEGLTNALEHKMLQIKDSEKQNQEMKNVLSHMEQTKYQREMEAHREIEKLKEKGNEALSSQYSIESKYETLAKEYNSIQKYKSSLEAKVKEKEEIEQRAQEYAAALEEISKEREFEQISMLFHEKRILEKAFVQLTKACLFQKTFENFQKFKNIKDSHSLLTNTFSAWKIKTKEKSKIEVFKTKFEFSSLVNSFQDWKSSIQLIKSHKEFEIRMENVKLNSIINSWKSQVYQRSSKNILSVLW